MSIEHETSAPPFTDHREAAFALLIAFREGRVGLTRKAASFTGESLVDETPLSEKQHNWMQTLLAKAGLPPLTSMEGRHG